MTETKNRVPIRWQLLIFGWLLAGLLAFNTLGALWEYVDQTQASNGRMLKTGFAACEASIFIWIFWHVFRRWIWTRVWCLIAATIMGIFLVVHSSAVTKYTAQKKESTQAVTALANGLATITESASKGAIASAGQVAENQRRGGAPNSARATVREASRAAAEVATQNGKTLADAAMKTEQQAKNSTFLSADYLNGKMFAVVFTVLLILSFITFCVFEAGKAEEDDDHDGIPNFADFDSQFYNAKRAEKWWAVRGQQAPHLRKDSGDAEPVKP